jgi:hypothetical protein
MINWINSLRADLRVLAYSKVGSNENILNILSDEDENCNVENIKSSVKDLYNHASDNVEYWDDMYIYFNLTHNKDPLVVNFVSSNYLSSDAKGRQQILDKKWDFLFAKLSQFMENKKDFFVQFVLYDQDNDLNEVILFQYKGL